MRLARVRRALGPLEPPLLAAYRWLRATHARWMRPAVVVVATDAPHLDRATELAGRLGGAFGIWLTASDDVAPFGTLGWFVIRREPASWTETAVDRQVASVRRALRVRRVIDLRD